MALNNKMTCGGVQGTLDSLGNERENVYRILRNVFESYGAENLETSILEYLSVLDPNNEKDGIFQLVNKKVGLRYDQTVGLGRYCEQNGIKKGIFGRIGKVFRRDTPSVEQKRFREFTQADFDIVGPCNNREVNVLCCMIDCLNVLGIKEKIRVRCNDRRIVRKMIIECCGEDVDVDWVCLTLDKMDKKGWKGVRELLLDNGLFKEPVVEDQDELLREPIDKSAARKYLSEEMVDRLEEYVCQKKDVKDMFDVKEKIEMVQNVCSLVENGSVEIVLDISMVRGLGYYTGFIFEVSLGDLLYSVGGGGVYDNMIRNTECIGMSIGIERILDYVNMVENEGKLRCAVYSFIGERAKVCVERECRKVGWIVDVNIVNKKLGKFLGECNRVGMNRVVIVDDKYRDGIVSVKDMQNDISIDLLLEEIDCIGKYSWD